VPEGDTVWLSAKRMQDALAGDALTSSDFRVPRYATVDLTGRRVLEVVPRGKHMFTRLDDGVSLHSHFKMTGTWRIFAAGARWAGGPANEIRIVLATATHTAVGYRIPVIDLLATRDENTIVGDLGPDLLGPDWDPVEAVRRIAAEPDRDIGEALLCQRNLAGIGNLYKAEALFLIGVTPWTPVREVTRLDRLVELSQQLLRRNRDHAHQATTGNLRRGEQTWVYGRAGRGCRRCGEPVRRYAPTDDPNGRISFWCPRCQTGPAPTPAAIRPA
jgi:endonuclease-8